MIYYYSISAILSGFWMIMFLARFEGKKINYYFTIFSLLTSVASLGYVSLVTSSSVSEAILANKSYLMKRLNLNARTDKRLMK